MTTFTRQSLSGSELAQVASTLLVCAGLVLLLPAPASSDRDTLNEASTTVCAERADAPGDHHWANGAVVEAPDSCDDEDDDGDGDDSSRGAGHAITAFQRTPAKHTDALHVVHVDSETHRFHPLDAHSLRGPPPLQKESSDADVDDDDDDDSAGVHHAIPHAAASSRERRFPVNVECFRSTSIASAQALRAPPCSSPH